MQRAIHEMNEKQHEVWENQGMAVSQKNGERLRKEEETVQDRIVVADCCLIRIRGKTKREENVRLVCFVTFDGGA